MGALLPLETALAVLWWLASFLWLRVHGSWLPLMFGAVALAGFALWRDAELRGSLKLDRRAIALAAAGTVAMIGATYLLYPFFVHAWPSVGQETASLLAWLAPQRYPKVVTGCLLAVTAASEEVLFRGRVLSGDQRRLRRCLGSSLVYAAAHLMSASPLLIAVAFGCGCFWALLRAFSRSVGASIAVHVLWDLCVLLCWPLPARA